MEVILFGGYVLFAILMLYSIFAGNWNRLFRHADSAR